MINLRLRQRTAMVGAVALASFGILPAAASAGQVAEASPTQVEAPINWSPCHGGNFECATVQAPLDYDDPAGPKIDLAVVRLPASDPAHRIGSLFLNPGGPGGSGVDIVLGIGPFLPPELTQKFDLVGFDPRGILRSTPLLCFDSLEEAVAVYPPFPFPVSRAEEALQKNSDYALADACATRGGDIRDHMSTADVARDMDLLRGKVGDNKLTYLGFSYGSYLGQVYANMFPDRVRALVIDGVLDPIAWSTGRGSESLTKPFTERLKSAVGARKTLNQFFEQCDAARRDCAFSGNSKARYEGLAQQLRAHPIDLPDGPFTYADLIANSLSAMYGPASWPDFAKFLAELEASTSPPAIASALAALRERTAPARSGDPDYPNFVEGFPGVICSDSINPPNYRSWPQAADRTERTQGRFGRAWLWASGVCQPWAQSAGQDRYLGPWTASTSAPVLVVGNYYDPATPYRGAKIAADLLPRSTLLTYAGWGHTAFAGGNSCIDASVARYLVTQQTPTPGTVCEPEETPFGAPDPIAVGRQAAMAAAGGNLLPESVHRAGDRG
jgi:pimeloyl-ACP methyl ester carboxylesterase